MNTPADESQNRDRVRIRQLPTGVPGLDEILGGGLPEYSFEQKTAATLAAHPTVSHPAGLVPLESILCTEELSRRPARQPAHAVENRALAALAQALADSPRTILQRLAETVLEVFQVGSAGISLLTEDAKWFYWPAIAGAWKAHIGGGTPRDFGPCGDVLDRNASLLFKHIERRYEYFLPVTPLVKEALLVPFHVAGQAVGTIWAVTHDEHRRFDAEDLRQLERLGQFAAAAYQTVESLTALELRRDAALNLMEDAVESRQTAERLNQELQESEQKSREQSLALVDLHRRKDEFLAMLSHELRNPLAPISNAVHLLRLRKDEDEDQRLVCSIIERQVTQLTRLVDDLMEVSRITTGRVQLRRDRVVMSGIVERGVEAAHPLMDQRRHELTVSLPPEPIWLVADAARLEQVVVNLLTNAAKYTDEGGRIWLSVKKEEDECVLCVRDTGVGIAPDLLPRIFDLFTQAERSLDRSQGGLGIGLALVQRLVELHGGRVEVHSSLGKGSEFVVRLPLSTLAAPLAEPKVAVAPLGPSRRVLVVDDNQDAARSLAMLLKAAGHETATAYDGPTALKTAAACKPAVVLLDIGLPGLDGYEVAKRLRQQPALENLTLIALTGYGNEADHRRSKEAGFDHHLVKPVEFPKLQAILGTIAERT